MRSENKKTYRVVYASVIAALYVVLTMLFLPIAYGPISFRISELLCILPYFTPAAVPGLAIGCFLANLMAGAAPMDIVFGSLATLIGAWGSWRLRKYKWLVCVPPILANTAVIPWVLKLAYGSGDLMVFLIVTVFISEAIAVGILGNGLLLVLEKYAKPMFGKAMP